MSGRRSIDTAGHLHPDKSHPLNRAFRKGRKQKVPTTKILMGIKSRCGLCRRPYLGPLIEHLKECGTNG